MWATAPGPGIFGFRIPVTICRFHNMSFVSITFDKCRYRLPKFDAAVGEVYLVPWFRDSNLRV